MKSAEIKQLLKEGEGLHVEFKESMTSLPRSLFDSVCAFLNTDGGTILLGVSDTGKVVGIDPDTVASL
jgi:ATP-dependent DNA helicase RecG